MILRRSILALTLCATSAAAAPLDPLAFVDSQLTLSADQLETVAALLPERPNPTGAFTDQALTTDLLVEEATTISVTFVAETSDQRNSLGWFRYTTEPLAVSQAQLVFPDARGAPDGPLTPGDTGTLKNAAGTPVSFQPGDRVGFFLVADGAKSKEIKSWDASLGGLPHVDGALNADVGRGLCTTLDALNPETAAGREDVARRVALFSAPDLLVGPDDVFVLGFEATDRADPRSDHDFNDLVVLVHSDGLATAGVLPATLGDPDGDGVSGMADGWPLDAQRATSLRVPPAGFELLAYDRGYPASGDGDHNDLVFGWAVDLVLDAQGDVKDVFLQLHLLARDLGHNDRFGLHLPGLPADASGDILIERFLADDVETHEVELVLRIENVVDIFGRRIEALFPETSVALKLAPGVSGPGGVNTTHDVPERPAASARMLMTFDDAVDPVVLGPPPWDPYVVVDTDEGDADVHLSGRDSLPVTWPAGLPVESGAGAYQDADGRPWLLRLPAGRFALDGKPFEKLHNRWLPWAASRGEQSPDWAERLGKSAAAPPVELFLRPHDWTLGLPER